MCTDTLADERIKCLLLMCILRASLKICDMNLLVSGDHQAISSICCGIASLEPPY